ncbi:hypothetical protein Patl1_05516 [Pistacia atlantica]|uniref:Uncharacterized protein n=1 Tax=Pistacia atlantica TaxID=434234 RepID=A0ACC1BW43_9ROSI|nr:hypothetical protein Patl1_05516 [Pistacia atlantica]
MYLTVLESSMGCVLGQHDESGRKERAIYYLSKKFTDYETRYSSLEKTCCALAWSAHRLRHYMLNFTTMLITRMDPLKYIFMLLAEFDIIYVTQKSIKGQVIADQLAENPVPDVESMQTYFPDDFVRL